MLLSGFLGVNNVTPSNILLGVEADYDKRYIENNSFQELGCNKLNDYPVKTKVKYSYSLRGRFGYVFNDDKTLVYATGGYGGIRIKRSYGYLSSSLSHNKTIRQHGFVVGGGLAQRLSKNISARAEYRFAKYHGKGIGRSSIYGGGTIEKQEYKDHSIRFGISYTF